MSSVLSLRLIAKSTTSATSENFKLREEALRLIAKSSKNGTLIAKKCIPIFKRYNNNLPNSHTKLKGGCRMKGKPGRPKKTERRGGWNKKYATPEEAKQAHLAAARRYDQKHFVTYRLKVSIDNEPDIASKLKSVEDMGDYVKELIRKDLGIDN